MKNKTQTKKRKYTKRNAKFWSKLKRVKSRGKGVLTLEKLNKLRADLENDKQSKLDHCISLINMFDNATADLALVGSARPRSRDTIAAKYSYTKAVLVEQIRELLDID